MENRTLTFEDFKNYCEKELEERKSEKRKFKESVYWNFEKYEKQYICYYERYGDIKEGVIVGRYSYTVEWSKGIDNTEHLIKVEQLRRLQKIYVPITQI